ncbi:MAG: efflux RND transporter periplasmic adaptor subunit [Hyphomicrobiaceae bacterium]
MCADEMPLLRPARRTRAGSQRSSAVCVAIAWTLVAALAVSGGAALADDLPVRGVVKAVNKAALSTDIAMRVLRLPYREGQRFKAGDVLAAFDCRRQEAELEAARGALREAELNAASSLSLDRRKAIGRFDVEIAQARLDRVRGELKGLEARVDDCTIAAPFNGRVAERAVQVREFTTAQRPFLGIIEDDNYEIELIVSSAAMTRISVGQPIMFRLDDMPDAPVHAVVTLVAAVVDPISKTGKIVAAVRASPPELVAGMSGTASFGGSQK